MNLRSLFDKLAATLSKHDRDEAKESAFGAAIQDRLRGVARHDEELLRAEPEEIAREVMIDDASGGDGREPTSQLGIRKQEVQPSVETRRTDDPGSAHAAAHDAAKETAQVLTWLDKLSKREVSPKKEARAKVAAPTWRSWLICVPFALVAFYCGTSLGSFGVFYAAVLEGSGHATWLLYKLMIGMALMSVTGGIVATLMRPLMRGAVAIGVGAVAMILGWGMNLWSLIGAAVFFVAGLSYAMSIEKATASQVQFPVWSIGRMSTQILTGVSIAACASLYSGASEQIAQRGIVIPQRVWSVLGIGSDLYLDLVVPPEYRGPELEQQSEVFQHHVLETITALAEPHERFVPVVYCVLLFSFLVALERLVTIITGPAIVGCFRLLEALRLARFEIQTQEVRRLVTN